MKFGSDATKPLALLAGVLEAFKLEFHKHLVDAGPEWLGINLTYEDFLGIAEATRAPSGIIGWFGYEANASGRPRLVIWFYTSKLQSRARRSVLDEINGRLPPGINRAQKNEYGDIGVFCDAERSAGDLEWFESVLRVLKAGRAADNR